MQKIDSNWTKVVWVMPSLSLDLVDIVSKAILDGEKERGTRPTAVQINLKLIGIRFTIVVNEEEVNQVIGNYEVYSKGTMVVSLSQLMKGDGLTTTVNPHPARASKNTIIKTLKALTQLAEREKKFAPHLQNLFAHLQLGTDDPRRLVHMYFTRFINDAVFGGKFVNLFNVMREMQKMLPKLLPYNLSQSLPWYHPMKYLMKLGARGINSDAEFIRNSIMSLISQMRHDKGGDYGILNALSELSDKELSGQVNSLLQGLLDTTGNSCANILMVLASNPELYKVVKEKKAYVALADMVFAVFSAGPIMLRQNEEGVALSGINYEVGQKIGASMYHLIRHHLGGVLNMDIDWISSLDEFINETDIAKKVINLTYGGPSHTHCAGRVTAQWMGEKFSMYIFENDIQLEILGTPVFVNALTAYTTGYSIKALA